MGRIDQKQLRVALGVLFFCQKLISGGFLSLLIVLIVLLAGKSNDAFMQILI